MTYDANWTDERKAAYAAKADRIAEAGARGDVALERQTEATRSVVMNILGGIYFVGYWALFLLLFPITWMMQKSYNLNR